MSYTLFPFRMSKISYSNSLSNMRSGNIVLKENISLLNNMCILCKAKQCIVDHSENKVYSGRITRSITRWLQYISNFVVIEVYRSMPLLGDEDEIPNWDVHLAHYSVVFSDKYQ